MKDILEVINLNSVIQLLENNVKRHKKLEKIKGKRQKKLEKIKGKKMLKKKEKIKEKKIEEKKQKNKYQIINYYKIDMKI